MQLTRVCRLRRVGRGMVVHTQAGFIHPSSLLAQPGAATRPCWEVLAAPADSDVKSRACFNAAGS